jgi:hypothetical protein
MRACRGSAIALLDGDDYWSTTHKYSSKSTSWKPVIFSLCFHEVAWNTKQLCQYKPAPSLTAHAKPEGYTR